MRSNSALSTRYYPSPGAPPPPGISPHRNKSGIRTLTSFPILTLTSFLNFRPIPDLQTFQPNLQKIMHKIHMPKIDHFLLFHFTCFPPIPIKFGPLLQNLIFLNFPFKLFCDFKRQNPLEKIISTVLYR